jgi:choline dehydrogenase-like flavoprotein
MISDARTLPSGAEIQSDVVIVGAGAAGISLARDFIGKSLQVCLLESGGLEFDPQVQSLYEGQNIGMPYYALDTARLRYFGGTTNHWGGMCRPLDEIDFQKRPWVPHSGWPITRSDLNPYYRRALPICGFEPNTSFQPEELDRQLRMYVFPGGRIQTTIFQISGNIRFGEAYRREIQAADNIHTFLNANLLEVETDPAVRTVTRLQVSTLEGKRFTVAGKAVVLAAGGIENARILLLSNRTQRDGLGNQNDLVGRFFTEHPMLNLGWLLPADKQGPLNLPVAHELEGTRVVYSGALTLSAEAQAEGETLNHITRLLPRWNDPSRQIEGLESFRSVARQLQDGELPDDFARHVKNILRDMDLALPMVYRRRRTGAFLQSHIRLLASSECAPNPASRVTLSHERDQLDLNRAQLDWRLTELDTRSLRKALEITAREVGRLGLGRVRSRLTGQPGWPMPTANAPWTGPRGNYHHMGTTRMSDDPKQGVVNANCKVHGISNLFVAGSSVFPTCGYANPTLTIVALSLRLAEHLQEVLRS